MKFRIPKLSSFVYYFKFYLNTFKFKIKQFQERIIIYKWINSINVNNNQVLIGANVSWPNGVDFHIHAISKYSELKTELIPSDSILNLINTHNFKNEYLDKIQITSKSVIHSHVYPWFIEWCAKQKTNNHTIKWIHTYHAHYSPEYSHGEFLDWQQEFNRVFIEVASKADVKISVSKWQQKIYMETFNIDTIYIPNGVNVVQCDAANAEVFIKKHGIKDFILNVSRHDPVKNPREFVQLAIVMPEKNFVIIGSSLTRELFIEEYDVTPPENLTILGAMSQAEVQNAIAACTVLVSTAKREGLPTLVLEGMAHKKPVVVSNEPGSMEAIDNGNYGYYYELGNLEDLKSKTLEALNDSTIGLKARQRVLEEYDWRVVIKQVDQIYSELL